MSVIGWVPLEKVSEIKIYVHMVYWEGSQLQQLSGSEESRIEKKRKLNCKTVPAEALAEFLGSSGAGLANFG